MRAPRLRMLPPRLKPLPARLAALPEGANHAERGAHRDATTAWRAWYKTSRWQRLRWSVLVRDMFTCAMCGTVMRDTSQLVCDHVEPHRGDEARFWAGPFQTLCKPCHDGAKQRSEWGRG